MIITADIDKDLVQTSKFVPRPKPFLVSAAASALILFALINIGAFYSAQFYSRHKNKTCDYIIDAFKNTDQSPNIVMLGSSLMRFPFYQSDINHSYYAPRYEEYCWNRTLANLLNNFGQKKYSVFDLAIDGAMVSDVYLINKKLLKGSKIPEWVIYGVAPRDLLDNCLSKETRTPVFDKLFSFRDMWQKKSNFNISLVEKIDLIIEKFCFLYSDRSTIQSNLADTYHTVEKRMLSFGSNNKIVKKDFLDSESLQQLASEKNLKAYRERYKIFQPAKFEKQKSFLKAFCDESQKKGINVLLINMPLTPEITDLIPTEAHNAYIQALNEIGKLPRVNLLNLDNSNNFPNSSFGDLVHLNGLGGHYLNMLLSRTILKNSIPKQNINSIKRQTNMTDGSACWWLTKAYFSETKAPDIVVLGGSQLGALLGADAYVYNRSVDFTGNYRSCLLEHDMKMLLNKDFRVFISALPGSLISDQLVASRTLFSKQYKPKYVAIAFSPKDFLAKNIPSITTTEPYTFFSKLHGADIHQHSLNTPSRNIQENNMTAKIMQKLLEQRAFKNISFKPGHDREMLCVSPLNLANPFQRFYPGEVAISQNDGWCFYNNSEDYKRIYREPNNQRLKFQLGCLQKLLSYLAQQHIKVVVFNLPLTDANKALLPASFWPVYYQQIIEMCHSNQADFIDLDNDWKAFTEKEYVDTAHLNLAGGLKLTRPLALFIANKFREVDFAELRRREHKML